MTKEEVAAQMNGREYGEEGTDAFFEMVGESRLVCLFGYSDDVVEVRGAENDELGTSDIFFTETGLLRNRCEDDMCPYHRDERRNAYKVEVFDGGEEFGMFEFRTSIPHSIFKIMEDGELYGSGIVFSLDELQ